MGVIPPTPTFPGGTRQGGVTGVAPGGGLDPLPAFVILLVDFGAHLRALSLPGESGQTEPQDGVVWVDQTPGQGN